MSTRSKRYQKQSRSRNRKRVVQKQQQNTVGLWLLLVVVLLAMVVWALLRISIDLLHQIQIGGIVLLLMVVLMIVVWFARRYRLTPEEYAQREKRLVERQLADETALAIGSRAIELDDLRYLTKGKPGDEFEDFTAALLIAMGVVSELERVGGAGDRGIDLRGKAGRLPFIVQCKHFFGHAVTAEQARGFGWALTHNAYKGWFVTTWTFSPQARTELDQLTEQGRAVLVEGRELISYIREHWNALPDDWQWRLTQCMMESDRQRQAE